MSKSMYIHVPFCDYICAYCDFERCRKHPILIDKWLKIICEDIKKRDHEKIDTLYIGGGTPTSLSYAQLDQLLSALDPFDPVEYTIEANIENLTKEKIELMVKHHINRISLGVQSLNDHLIQLIERHHTSKEIFSKIDEIYECGIHNISVDMIYGLPEQTLEIWLSDLKKIALNEKVSHISIYSLTIEENSAFKRKNIQKAGDELDETMYFEGIALLEKYGFEQYEISNFARNGKYSLHNCSYWNYDDFIGLGCGAYGKEEHFYYHYPFQLNDYLNGNLKCEKTWLSESDEMFESIMMGLRLKKGISLEQFKIRYQRDLLVEYEEAINKHVELDNIKIDNEYLRCTSKGFALLNSILIDFMK